MFYLIDSSGSRAAAFDEEYVSTHFLASLKGGCSMAFPMRTRNAVTKRTVDGCFHRFFVFYQTFTRFLSSMEMESE